METMLDLQKKKKKKLMWISPICKAVLVVGLTAAWKCFSANEKHASVLKED